MSASTEINNVPRVAFSHMGINVQDIVKMEAFYTRALGFTVTDRGKLGPVDIVFLSRDPNDHHQIVLATGRPDNLPPNALNPERGPSINQVSFRIESLSDLRIVRERLEAEGASNIYSGNHGIAWSIYANDPEGNRLEFFVDTEWYITQPFLVPLDLTKTDGEIAKETQALCASQPGFESYGDWRSRIGKRMIRA